MFYQYYYKSTSILEQSFIFGHKHKTNFLICTANLCNRLNLNLKKRESKTVCKLYLKKSQAASNIQFLLTTKSCAFSEAACVSILKTQTKKTCSKSC